MKALTHSSAFRVAPSVAYPALRACASAENGSPEPGSLPSRPRAARQPVAAPPRFPRSAKLLRHADFQRVYQQGRRHFAANLTVFYVRRAGSAISGPRLGFTVGRALGGAVERNRIKRRLREAVRTNLAALVLPVDVVINPKKSARTLDFALLRKEVARAFDVIRDKESRP